MAHKDFDDNKYMYGINKGVIIEMISHNREQTLSIVVIKKTLPIKSQLTAFLLTNMKHQSMTLASKCITTIRYQLLVNGYLTSTKWMRILPSVVGWIGFVCLNNWQVF